MLDLLNIAKTEADGNDLLKLISSLYKSSDIRPKGYPNAIVWEGGNFDKNINPIAHSLTDAYALLGTIAAIDILNLPFYAVPMWSQIRHDKILISEFKFPVDKYPTKVKSLNLSKTPNYEGKLTGIKGQYLIFDDQTVFNIRSNEGQKIKLIISN